MSSNIIGISGVLERPSKTTALVEIAVRASASRFGRAGTAFDLHQLGSSLGSARQIRALPIGTRAVFDMIVSADALVVGLPEGAGAHHGMFRNLFQLIGSQDLQNKPVLLVTAARTANECRMVEDHMRPFLSYFGMRVFRDSVQATEQDFIDSCPVSDALQHRLGQSIGQFVPYFAQTLPHQVIQQFPARAA